MMVLKPPRSRDRSARRNKAWSAGKRWTLTAGAHNSFFNSGHTVSNIKGWDFTVGWMRSGWNSASLSGTSATPRLGSRVLNGYDATSA